MGGYTNFNLNHLKDIFLDIELDDLPNFWEKTPKQLTYGLYFQEPEIMLVFADVFRLTLYRSTRWIPTIPFTQTFQKLGMVYKKRSWLLKIVFLSLP